MQAFVHDKRLIKAACRSADLKRVGGHDSAVRPGTGNIVVLRSDPGREIGWYTNVDMARADSPRDVVECLWRNGDMAVRDRKPKADSPHSRPFEHRQNIGFERQYKPPLKAIRGACAVRHVP